MIELDAAQAIAQRELTALELEVGAPLAFDETSTIERARAWVFFYNSVEFLNTGVVRFRLAGNAQLLSGKMQVKCRVIVR